MRQKGETWLMCDDEDVSPVHEEDVLKLSGGGDWHTAYLLLYAPRWVLTSTVHHGPCPRRSLIEAWGGLKGV